MDYFSLQQKIALARSLITKTSPAYVQFYITARCNLACERCNIIYADANAQEMTIDQIRLMADNLAAIGVCGPSFRVATQADHIGRLTLEHTASLRPIGALA